MPKLLATFATEITSGLFLKRVSSREAATDSSFAAENTLKPDEPDSSSFRIRRTKDFRRIRGDDESQFSYLVEAKSESLNGHNMLTWRSRPLM